MSDEKRRTRRILSDMPAELTVANARYTVKQILNLSVGGCLLAIKDNLPTGAECALKILIDGTPDGLRVDANGQIVRNSQLDNAGANQVNVSFTINAVDTAGFDQLLNSRRGQIVGMINRAMNERGRVGVV